MTNDGYSYAASSEMVGYKTLYSYQCDNCGGIVTGKRHKRIRGHVYCEDCKKIVYKYTKEQTLSKHWRLELMEAFKKHGVSSVEGLYEAGRSDALKELKGDCDGSCAHCGNKDCQWYDDFMDEGEE